MKKKKKNWKHPSVYSMKPQTLPHSTSKPNGYESFARSNEVRQIFTRRNKRQTTDFLWFGFQKLWTCGLEQRTRLVTILRFACCLLISRYNCFSCNKTITLRSILLLFNALPIIQKSKPVDYCHHQHSCYGLVPQGRGLSLLIHVSLLWLF